MYFKEKQRSMAGKDPLIRRFLLVNTGFKTHHYSTHTSLLLPLHLSDSSEVCVGGGGGPEGPDEDRSRRA